MIKYEEVLKELEKLKKDKIFFNQNLNLIDNTNQNISINIFPKNSKFDEKLRSKHNEKKDIYFTSKKIKNNNFVINRKINIQILSNSQNDNDDGNDDSDNSLLTKKNKALTKIINNTKKYILKDFFDNYQNKVNLLKYIEKHKNYEDNNKKRNMIINKVIKFSLINNNDNDKNNKNIDIVIDINNTKNIFSQSKVIITKNIGKFKIINENNNNNNNCNKNKKEFIKNKFNDSDLIINKKNDFHINKKKKEEFIIVKQMKNIKINSEKEIDGVYHNHNNHNSNNYINNNLIIHKVINYVIKNDIKTYENQIINYIKKNRKFCQRIKNELNLNMNLNVNWNATKKKDDNLVINKVNNININKIKKRDNNNIFLFISLSCSSYKCILFSKE